MDWKRLGGKVPGAEGPLERADGSWLMVGPSQGEVLRWDPDAAEWRVIAQTGGIPAGLAADSGNRVWIADMKRGVLMLDADDRLTDVATELDGRPMRGCNDLCFDDHGHLYVTAPAGSSAAKPDGEVFFVAVDGSPPVQIAQGLAFPNGIALDASGTHLFVAETHTRSIWRHRVVGPGQVEAAELFAHTPEGGRPAGPDGMDFDASGRLLVANWGGDTIDVFREDGSLERRLELPCRHPSNVHLLGREQPMLLITEHENHGAWITPWDQPGIRLPDPR